MANATCSEVEPVSTTTSIFRLFPSTHFGLNIESDSAVLANEFGEDQWDVNIVTFLFYSLRVVKPRQIHFSDYWRYEAHALIFMICSSNPH